MADNTKISWCNATWNPLRGCTRVSPGCQSCYAERMCSRGLPGLASPTTGDDFAVKTPSGPRWTGKVELIESALEIPLRWRKPRRIFVNSMSDTFHESVPDEMVDRIFAVMALCPQHTFQVLTKRAARLREYFGSAVDLRSRWSDCLLDVRNWPSNWGDCRKAVLGNPSRAGVAEGLRGGWRDVVLPNVWLGVSVEDQQRADERIPLLLQTPAAVRWVSVEPMLGPVDLTRWLRVSPNFAETCSQYRERATLDWVIVGGESGPNARPFDVAAGRLLRRQCLEAGVPLFWKQFGALPIEPPCRQWHWEYGESIGRKARFSEFGTTGNWRVHFTDRAGSDLAEWPEWARVQQFPERKDGGRKDGGK